MENKNFSGSVTHWDQCALRICVHVIIYSTDNVWYWTDRFKWLHAQFLRPYKTLFVERLHDRALTGSISTSLKMRFDLYVSKVDDTWKKLLPFVGWEKINLRTLCVFSLLSCTTHRGSLFYNKCVNHYKSQLLQYLI